MEQQFLFQAWKKTGNKVKTEKIHNQLAPFTVFPPHCIGYYFILVCLHFSASMRGLDLGDSVPLFSVLIFAVPNSASDTC